MYPTLTCAPHYKRLGASSVTCKKRAEGREKSLWKFHADRWPAQNMSSTKSP
eukprot:CAMPEP_0115696184 /NCGR_PEP_ID=MMETSP0272-20121206/65149_1 /TAXON_ID=71861 /ORGANISM="Scrippsiella trochoidea, Strain CCMP3099" /LENGTH=51 /DNA_ID=CAMNT_0003136403 /DNA_START=304 /DNA_END=455 /DNA_ORIENTATION=-